MGAPEDFGRTVDVYNDLFGNRWNIVVINELVSHPKRFNEIKKSLEPVSQTVLVRHLRQLEEYGIIKREVMSENPLSVRYCITEAGIELYDAMMSTFTWIIRHQIMSSEESDGL